MKLTNQEIINLCNAFDSLSEKELPIKITYQIVNNLNVLVSAYQIFDKAKQKVKTEEELIELLNIEKELDLELINKNELIDADVKITPAQLVGLKRIING